MDSLPLTSKPQLAKAERRHGALPALESQEQARLGENQVHIVPGHRRWLGWELSGETGWETKVTYAQKWKGTASAALKSSAPMPRASAALEAVDAHLCA